MTRQSGKALPDQSTAPRTLEEVRVIADPILRARAATAYLARLHDREREAMTVRDEALVAARPLRAPETAERVGVSVSVVKHARRSS